MSLNTRMFRQIPSLLRKRTNLFYIFAFIPLLLILYYDVWILVIAFYGFIFFLLKSEKLHSAKEANTIQMLLGLIIVIGSFFIYYALVPVFPRAGFYGAANYVVFLFGLCMIFFDLSVLKQAFTPLFFITAATSSYLIAESLSPYISPFLDDIAAFIVSILRILGIKANLYDSPPFVYNNIPVIGFTALSGETVYTAFAYECIGIFSAIVFSIILVIILFEDPSNWKTRILASIIAISGTFALNIIRVTIIYVTDFFYGAAAGADVHYVIGYTLFSVWLVFFLYIYSKRHTIRIRTQSFFSRTRTA